MKPATDSLVLYKIHPARVLNVGEKIEIELEGGQTKRVRPKDIDVLHPGPLRSLSDLVPQEGELEEAWSLLEGGSTHLAELAELIYADFTPPTAWATWQWVADGLFFTGTPAAIQVRSRAAVEHDRQERAERAIARRDWTDFLTRLRAGTSLPEDRERLGEVERVALSQSEQSRILDALGHQVTQGNAHRLLVQVGYWPPHYNPYPGRSRVSLAAPSLPVPELFREARRDLTDLPAYAIDDEGNQDPDDAISLDGERLWVHIADVAALVPSDSPLDLEARTHGANLYLPEGVVPMLPEQVTQCLGLGLQEVSPALSFGFHLGAMGPNDLEIVPSWVRVQRISYQETETCLEQEPFRSLRQITERFRAQRRARDAITIELPEVDLKVIAGKVRVRFLERLHSRKLVTDAMLMAGEAIARYCADQGIPIPYATQQAPDQLRTPSDLAAMWAYRKQLKPSRLSLEPAPHCGLGLEFYSRVTSPLRRYSDLLVHQQLRAHLAGREPLDTTQVAERINLAETASQAIRRVERQSNTHWKLVWLMQHPHWRGEGIVLDQDQGKVLVLIPELALDVKVRVQGGADLNTCLQLKLREIDLPDLICYFAARPC